MERYLLNEHENANSLEVLKTQYPQSIISHRVLETLYDEDPTNDKRLFNWMVKQNILTAHKADVNNQVIRLAREFVLLQTKLKVKDINFYHNTDILQNEINHVKAHLTKAEKRKYKIEEGTTIYEDSHYSVQQCVSEYEICNAGFDTNWCGTHGAIPEKVEDYVCYVIINKRLTHPDINTSEDYEEFIHQQQKFYSLRKLLVLIQKRFNGELNEADLDDYILVDAMGEIHEGALSELTNNHVARTIFNHFKEHKDQTVGAPINEQYQSPELNEGDKVELIYMSLKHSKMPNKGAIGEVTAVVHTPYGIQYQMKWDNGSTFALDPEEDIYKKIGTLNEDIQPKLLEHIKKAYLNKKIELDLYGHRGVIKIEDIKLGRELPHQEFTQDESVWFLISRFNHTEVCRKIINDLYVEVLDLYGIKVKFNII
jgi:hypothetical protein